MWQIAFKCSHVIRSPTLYGLISVNHGLKIPNRHHSCGQKSLVKRIETVTFWIQEKGWSSLTGNGDKEQNDQKAAKIEKEPTETDKMNVHGSNIYLSKEIYRSIKKKQNEQYFIYTDNNLMDVENAKKEYLLTDKDLEKLVKIKRSSPYSSPYIHNDNGHGFIECVWMSDVEKAAKEKWGSMEKLKWEKLFRKKRGSAYGFLADKEKPTLYETLKKSFGQDSGKVVICALVMNLLNALLKCWVWLTTGSPSMFSEFMHSCGDTMNQTCLAFGRFLSLKRPDSSHPYGYKNHEHIMSILSGGFIFSLGCGLTLYHGILGLMNPIIIDESGRNLIGYVMLFSLITESVSLSFAVSEISSKAKAAGMPFIKYVKEGDDPLSNVVLLEDAAGVLGVITCVVATSVSYAFGMPKIDAIGSLMISGMLGCVSWFLYSSNAGTLLGKALPYEEDIKKYLESDRFINAVLDNKTLDFGDESRFKSEVVMDAKLITKHFLNTEVDLDAMLVKWKSVRTTEEMELFLEEIGAQIYDQIVAHVDRKERDIKKKFPEIRHIDIEPS